MHGRAGRRDRAGRGVRAPSHFPVAAALSVESMAYSMLQHGDGFRRWLRTRTPRQPHATAADPVRLERDGPRLDISLHRPEVHNALDAALRDALCDAFDLVAVDPSIDEVHLRGDGPSLCSGGDLRGVRDRDRRGCRAPPPRRPQRRAPPAQQREQGDRPPAREYVGAGIEIATFASHVVADPDTTIRLPEVGMGLIPGAGGTASIPRRIGRHRTAYLTLSGIALDTTTATAWIRRRARAHAVVRRGRARPPRRCAAIARSSVPRYDATTRGSSRTSPGVPSAMTRPASRQ